VIEDIKWLNTSKAGIFSGNGGATPNV